MSNGVVVFNPLRLPPSPTTQGAVLYCDGSTWVMLPPGTAGYVLTTHGAGANPTWAAGGGGGTYTATAPVTLTGSAFGLSYSTGLTVSAGALVVDTTAVVPTSRTLTGTAPITVAGDNSAHDLSANRTIALTLTGSSLEVSSGGLRIATGAAGAGLTGGGAAALSVVYGSSGGTACQGNDTRLNPSPSAAGRLLYDTASAWAALAAGTAGQGLRSGGAGAPVWTTAVQSGALGSRPAASAALLGVLYVCTDTGRHSGKVYACIDTGSGTYRWRLVWYPQRVPTDGSDTVVWQCDETGGTTLANAITPGTYDLTTSGTGYAMGVRGRFAGGWSPSGGNSDIAKGAGTFRPAYPLTVDFWCFLRAYPASYARLICRPINNYAAPYMSLTATLNNNGAVSVDRAWGTSAGNSNTVSVSAARCIPLNTWTHVAITDDGTTITLYQRGVAMGTSTISGGPKAISYTTNGNDLWAIGANPGAVETPINGIIDDVRIASVVRSAAEIAERSDRGEGCYSEADSA